MTLKGCLDTIIKALHEPWSTPRLVVPFVELKGHWVKLKGSPSKPFTSYGVNHDLLSRSWCVPSTRLPPFYFDAVSMIPFMTGTFYDSWCAPWTIKLKKISLKIPCLNIFHTYEVGIDVKFLPKVKFLALIWS